MQKLQFSLRSVDQCLLSAEWGHCGSMVDWSCIVSRVERSAGQETCLVPLHFLSSLDMEQTETWNLDALQTTRPDHSRGFGLPSNPTLYPENSFPKGCMHSSVRLAKGCNLAISSRPGTLAKYIAKSAATT